MADIGAPSASSRFRRICVYCGSSSGVKPAYIEGAKALGTAMAKRGIKLTYGGGSIGLMGAIANSVLEGFGGDDDSVLGIMPAALMPREVSGGSIGTCQVVPDMHIRKKTMAKQSDAFIAMPGGYGTLEELLECMTWLQLGVHYKPIGVLNIAGYYDHFLALVDSSIAEGFVKPEQRNCIVTAATAEELLDKLEAHQPPKGLCKWVEEEDA